MPRPRRSPERRSPAAAGGAESDSSDDEASRAAKLAATSAEARRKGNAAFAAGEFAKAVKQFTMAIRMDKTNHVLFSNRSAAHARAGEVRGRARGRGAVRAHVAEVGQGIRAQGRGADRAGAGRRGGEGVPGGSRG